VSGVRARVPAAGKVLEGDDKPTLLREDQHYLHYITICTHIFTFVCHQKYGAHEIFRPGHLRHLPRPSYATSVVQTVATLHSGGHLKPTQTAARPPGCRSFSNTIMFCVISTPARRLLLLLLLRPQTAADSRCLFFSSIISLLHAPPSRRASFPRRHPSCQSVTSFPVDAGHVTRRFNHISVGAYY